jgi:hypothetical protein
VSSTFPVVLRLPLLTLPPPCHVALQGEMCVWAGLFVMAGPAVWMRCPWTVASPLFTYLLIRHMSGEAAACLPACCRRLTVALSANQSFLAVGAGWHEASGQWLCRGVPAHAQKCIPCLVDSASDGTSLSRVLLPHSTMQASLLWSALMLSGTAGSRSTRLTRLPPTCWCLGGHETSIPEGLGFHLSACMASCN